jgi:hypothetical protein
MVHPGARSRPELRDAVFRPPRRLGALIGLGVAVWCFGLGILAFRTALDGDATFETFLAWAATAVLMVIGATFLNWAYALATMEYRVEPDALVIRWGFRRVVIPLDTVLRLVPGRTLDIPPIEGMNWPGCHIGHGEIPRLGFTLFYATHRSADELVVIHTVQESYALSVLEQAAFAEEVQGRAAMGAIESHPQHSEASGVAAIRFWRDGVAVAAAALAVAGGALVCGYLSYRYEGLPEVIALNFPVLGATARVGEKSELLDMVYVSVGILAVSLVGGVALHARERAAGLWLLVSAGMLQLLLFAAAFTAVERS